MSKLLEFEALYHSVQNGAAAIRSVTTLQPVGGKGDRVFPPTFKDATYAIERRRVKQEDGKSTEIDCVLLDSVQSQANRAEEALLTAIRQRKIYLPVIEVDFAGARDQLLKPLGNITSLEVPHRLADAILRDASLPDGTRFSKSDYAKKWGGANLWNATPIYELCPTALLFGMWGSPLKPGGLGAKFERAFVSEIVGVELDPVGIYVDSEKPTLKRLGVRVDPLGASSKVPVATTEDGFEVLDAVKDAKKKGALRPSELNHGNILFDTRNCGVRFDHAEQVTVISLGALRKLHFPVAGKEAQALEIDSAASTVLAAIGLCAATFDSESGTSLRSRCQLWPEKPRVWEILETPGKETAEYHLDRESAAKLVKAAVAKAESLGLEWLKEKLVLRPVPELVKLIAESQKIAATDDTAEGQ
jgi:CRISPR-associated protein Csb1